MIKRHKALVKLKKKVIRSDSKNTTKKFCSSFNFLALLNASGKTPKQCRLQTFHLHILRK